MRTFALMVWVCSLACVSSLAFGQAPASASDGGATSLPRVRTPAGNPSDLEPAVDVGGSRGAGPASPTPRRSTAQAAAQGQVSAPATAAEPPADKAPAPAQTSATPRRRSGVMDTLDLGTTSITGNQELPKVLYIVPWKKSDLGDLVGRPANTLLDEVLEPVDPEVFERHLKYYETLYGDSAKE